MIVGPSPINGSPDGMLIHRKWVDAIDVVVHKQRVTAVMLRARQGGQESVAPLQLLSIRTQRNHPRHRGGRGGHAHRRGFVTREEGDAHVGCRLQCQPMLGLGKRHHRGGSATKANIDMPDSRSSREEFGAGSRTANVNTQRFRCLVETMRQGLRIWPHHRPQDAAARRSPRRCHDSVFDARDDGRCYTSDESRRQRHIRRFSPSRRCDWRY